MPADDWLSRKDFAHVVRCAPLVSVDLILTDHTGSALVGMRTNEPARGFYFVPGGVIRKNETIDCAFERILEIETELRARRSNATLLGIFEHFYETNRLMESGDGTHYVVLAYGLQVTERPVLLPDEQHSAFRWMSPADLVAPTDVHENTKVYFL
ncbi:MAG: GDP-mannose mannosyl hydrolase [Alphaproteobacteria bacterium]|nr:GDP-mannose mannosyl hydrolase [Alphaproteobacteria bacterium]MDE2493202.1 GDP-mannose mannosyl hydrolase [Alphaproteobacteria bacterium]